ncbi:MAG: HAMP domain-containing histidine kinase [Betaproteobacteria bacterium]|nr:MAG: HAMP domain-containing histidine kinase [Betaproteobacteria bacterium]
MKSDLYSGPPTERRNEFLSVLAHELRNHVAPIRNAVHLLRLRDGSDPNIGPMLEMIERQVAAIVHELEVIVEAERASRGDLLIVSAKVDVSALVSRAVERARPEAMRRRQTLRVEQMQAEVPAYGDPSRLAQVLDTVLDNAMRYTPNGGDILVEVEPAADGVAIRVRDSGSGIAADFLPRVFDYFSGRDRLEHGVGVGLAVARKLMQMQGGSIDARSAGLGAGSEFVIGVPVASPEARVRGTPNADSASTRHDGGIAPAVCFWPMTAPRYAIRCPTSCRTSVTMSKACTTASRRSSSHSAGNPTSYCWISICRSRTASWSPGHCAPDFRPSK